MAECALAMQLAGDKAEIAAIRYEDLVEECKSQGLGYVHYANIAALFRGIVASNETMDFKDLIKVCLDVAEVCR